MAASLVVFLLAASAAMTPTGAVKLTTGRTSTETSGPNPIHKVVTLMETMQSKIEAEAKKENELFDKFECYCKKTQNQLEAEIAKAADVGNVKPEDIEGKQAELKALQQSVEKLKNEKIEEEETLAAARAQREKEHQAFLKDETDQVGTENAAESAITALKSNETDKDNTTHRPVKRPNSTSLLSRAEKFSQGTSAFSRQLAAFFQSQERASPGEATSYIKDLEEKSEENWRQDVAQDTTGAKQFAGTKTSKEKSIKTVLNTLTKKMKKIGDLKVEIVNMKNMMAGGAEALAENKKLLAELKKDCAKRVIEQDEKVAIRAEEEKALQDTIQMLNSDDALDLFRKTIKKSSFLQLDTAKKQAREEARRILSSSMGRPEVSFIAMALAGKKVDFTKVFKKIDSMVALLGKEGSDDVSKKEYCNNEFDEAKDKAKNIKIKISELSASIEEKQASIEQLVADIKSINEGVQSLDESVAQATENRKAESADYQELIQQDTAAVELLGMAKNRLNQFYNPNLAKTTTTKSPYDLSLVSVDEQKPQVQASNGVLSMVDTMITDLEKEMLVAKTEEKNSQEEYEATIGDAREKRKGDLKDAEGKAQMKADLERDSEEDTQEKSAKEKKQQAAAEFSESLHKECDWLLQNFDVRKQARGDEVEHLKQAKAVLAGADFS